MTETRRVSFATALIAAALVVLMGLFIAISSAQAAEDSRLERKVKVMERVLDEVLVQSPNIMVSPGGTTHGLILDGFGALFIIEGSIMGGEFLVGSDSFTFSHTLGMAFGDTPPPKVETDDEDVERELESWTVRREEAEAKQAEHLAALKVELADALIDYGATLGELDDDSWVAIAAFLGGPRLFGGSRDGERLLFKASMRDLRQHAAGTLGRDAVAARVVIEE